MPLHRPAGRRNSSRAAILARIMSDTTSTQAGLDRDQTLDFVNRLSTIVTGEIVPDDDDDAIFGRVGERCPRVEELALRKTPLSNSSTALHQSMLRSGSRRLIACQARGRCRQFPLMKPRSCAGPCALRWCLTLT